MDILHHKPLNPSNSDGIVYIRTDRLDGETNLKQRQEVDFFQAMDVGEVEQYEIVVDNRKHRLNEFQAKIRKIAGDEEQDSFISDEVPLNEGESGMLVTGRPAGEGLLEAETHGLVRLLHPQRRGDRPCDWRGPKLESALELETVQEV